MNKKPNLLFKFLTLNYFFFLSWNGVVPAGEILRPYIVVGFLLVAYSAVEVFYKKSANKRLFYGEDVFLILFAVGLLAVSFAAATFNFNYIVVYLLIIIIFYLAPKVLFNSSIRAHLIFKYNSYSVLIISFLSLINFFTIFLINVDIFDIFTRIKPAQAVYGGLFPRNYGPSAEPGAFVFYLETMGVIGLWYFYKFIAKSTFSSLLYFIIFLLAVVSTFSAGAVAALGVAGIVCIMISFCRMNFAGLRWLSAGFIVLLSVGAIFRDFLYGIMLKLSLGDNSSANSRQEVWNIGVNLIADNLAIGIGLGQTTELLGQSLLSFYATLLAETGVFVTLMLLVFLALSFVRMTVGKNELIFVFAFVAGTAHLMIISTFYYPFIFLIIVMASIYYEFIKGRKKVC